jgi:hypothetical protein
MRRRPASRSRGARAALVGIDALIAANAVGGAWYALAGAPNVPTEWLRGTPFRDYRIPGAILGVAVGGTHAAATAALVRRTPHAQQLSTAAAGTLAVWTTAQLAMIGYRSPLQPAVLVAAAGSLVLSRRLAL